MVHYTNQVTNKLGIPSVNFPRLLAGLSEPRRGGGDGRSVNSISTRRWVGAFYAHNSNTYVLPFRFSDLPTALITSKETTSEAMS